MQHCDWSSDVCSSDLNHQPVLERVAIERRHHPIQLILRELLMQQHFTRQFRALPHRPRKRSLARARLRTRIRTRTRACARVSGGGSRCLRFIIIRFPCWVYSFRFCFCIVYISVVEIGCISVANSCAIGWTNGCAIAWVNAWVIRIVTGIVTDFGAISGAIGCAVSTDFTRIVTLKDRKSTRLNSSHNVASRMPSSA